MNFEKPCRIINPSSDIAVVQLPWTNTGFKEFQDSYELVVPLPAHFFCVAYVKNGRLYIQDRLNNGGRENDIIFLLPADVCQQKITASRIFCGLHVQLPKNPPVDAAIPVLITTSV